MNIEASRYYVLEYSSVDKGCPDNLSGFFNCDKFEWSPYETRPEKLEIKNEYHLTLSDSSIDIDLLDFDFYQVSVTYVSRKFLEVCDSLNSKYRAVPLEISSGGKIRKGDYFIFLPGESLSALDKLSSAYEVSKDLETGSVIQSPLYPGEISIAKVDSFVVKAGISSNIFRCQETLQLFCSDKFKSAAAGLKGISFVAVDQTYRYDPWAAFDDL
ncbi:hypothetical protein ACIPW4_27160 [Pseudomonas sp. NPDC089996]|uniref:hypothetical protein n=1 Tax=Pseudomonas sp. NPDC089996 TaxID=3364474 RepID=UPI003807CF42